MYYELLAEANFRTDSLRDITGWAVTRAHRRYGLKSPNADVTAAWTLLVGGAYNQDLWVQDQTGVPHLPGSDMSQFESDGYTPTATLCSTFTAWGHMLSAAKAVDTSIEPFRYDLVNLGREVLAQLSTPLSINFTNAFSATEIDPVAVNITGIKYISLLQDIDTLVGTDTAFLLGAHSPFPRQCRLYAAYCIIS